MSQSFSLRTTPVFLIVGLLLIAAAISFRNGGLYPLVFADEFSYSRMSRLIDFSSAYVPSYFYLLIYRVTNVCGDGFLSCSRLINIVFFVSGFWFVYLTAMTVMSRRIAGFITLLVAAGPLNTYTAYFMPEAFFFFGFWLFSWSLLRLDANSKLSEFVVPSLIFGMLTLIKPHPIFLYPGLILYFGFLSRQSIWTEWLRTCVSRSALFIVISIFVKLAIGCAIAGKSALTFFGSSYGSLAESAGSGLVAYMRLMVASAVSLSGHLMILCTLFGSIICALILSMARNLFRGPVISDTSKIDVYAFVVVFSLVVLSAVFTATIMHVGPYESLYRLHMRYYNFALPLLLIVAGSRISTQEKGWSWASVALAIIVVGVAGYAIMKGVENFAPGVVDAPDIIGFNLASRAFSLIAAIGMVATIIWAFNQRAGFRVFLLLFAPMMIVLNTVVASKSLMASIRPDVHDRAGSLAHALLTPPQRSRAIVFTTNDAGGFRTLFHIDSASSRLVTTSPPPVADIENLLRVDGAAVVIGEGSFAPKGADELKMDGFSIIRRGEFR